MRLRNKLYFLYYVLLCVPRIGIIKIYIPLSLYYVVADRMQSLNRALVYQLILPKFGNHLGGEEKKEKEEKQPE